jgi:hypothetical protein
MEIAPFKFLVRLQPSRRTPQVRPAATLSRIIGVLVSQYLIRIKRNSDQ